MHKLILTIFVGCLTVFQITAQQISDTFKEKFENKAQFLFQEYNLQGDFIIGVVNKSGLQYSYALNPEIISGKSSSLTNNSPIYIASHTKTLTGTLLKLLEEEGKIDLNSPIQQYLPELDFNGKIDTKNISVKQLLNHTHGFHSTIFTWKTSFLGYSGNAEELIDDLNTTFIYDNSHVFRYSNTGPIVAALIAEKVTGLSWKTLMDTYIFESLNMKNTSGNVSDFDSQSIRPAVVVDKNNTIFQSGFYKDDLTMHAAGGTLSTLNDLSLWVKANLNKDELFKNSDAWNAMHAKTADQKRTYFTYDRFGYSLGWDLANYQNETILTRFGGYNGISFHLSMIPQRNLGIVAFSSDGRATLLTHIMANYAYNYLKDPVSAETIFQEELNAFKKSFERNSSRQMPSAAMKLKMHSNSAILGIYKNEKGWPTIEIFKKDSEMHMKWGVLEGPIYQIPDPKNPYLGALGAVMRSFSVKNDSLSTGSLTYVRVKN